jgi:CBS domain-containing protein
MLVREVMSQPAVTVNDTASIKTAITLFERHDVSAMPVIDETGHLVGVISEADVIRESVLPDQRVHENPVHMNAASQQLLVADVMSCHPVTVTGDTDLAVAIDLMTTTAVKSLPVLDAGGLVGMVSRRDVIHVLARSDERIEADIDELFRQTGHPWLVQALDGIALIDGPQKQSERELAQALATTVPGVVGVSFAPVRSRRRP